MWFFKNSRVAYRPTDTSIRIHRDRPARGRNKVSVALVSMQSKLIVVLSTFPKHNVLKKILNCSDVIQLIHAVRVNKLYLSLIHI